MFGYNPTFHTLASVGRKEYFLYAENMIPLSLAILKFCSAKHLFNDSNYHGIVFKGIRQNETIHFIDQLSIRNSITIWNIITREVQNINSPLHIMK